MGSAGTSAAVIWHPPPGRAAEACLRNISKGEEAGDDSPNPEDGPREETTIVTAVVPMMATVAKRRSWDRSSALVAAFGAVLPRPARALGLSRPAVMGHHRQASSLRLVAK